MIKNDANITTDTVIPLSSFLDQNEPISWVIHLLERSFRL